MDTTDHSGLSKLAKPHRGSDLSEEHLRAKVAEVIPAMMNLGTDPIVVTNDEISKHY